MSEHGLVIINGLNSTLEFSIDGGITWDELPFAGDIEASGGDAPTNEIVTFRRVGVVTGHDRLPSLAVTIPSYIPHHSSWTNIGATTRAGNSIQWRIRTKPELIVQASGTGNTCAIATTGVCTLAPALTASPPHSVRWDTDAFGRGHVIKIGANLYTVASISAVGIPTIGPAPASAVSATVYSVVLPQVELPSFSGKAGGVDAFSLPAEGALNKTLTIQPDAALPAWRLVA